MSEVWYDRFPQRLEHEKVVMHDRFAKANPELRQIEDYLTWVLELTTNNGNTYKVLIQYPDNFPTRAPNSYILEPQIEPEHTKHMYCDGSLCLFHKDDRAWEYESTAATATAWIAAWLAAYEKWLETGVWHGNEIDH